MKSLFARFASASLGLCVVGLAACGGSSSTGASSAAVSGTISGRPVPTTDVAGTVGVSTATVSGITVSRAYAGVIITNIAGTCSVAQGGHNPPSTTVLYLSAFAEGASVAPGTYSITPTLDATKITATAEYATTDATCQGAAAFVGARGSITLTEVSSTNVQGSFDVTMGNGDHVSGSFDAPVCPIDVTAKNTQKACGA